MRLRSKMLVEFVGKRSFYNCKLAKILKTVRNGYLTIQFLKPKNYITFSVNKKTIRVLHAIFLEDEERDNW